MEIVRGYHSVPSDRRGTSAVIGNFDGVHLGHLAVLEIAREEARRRSCPLGVITFDPHPREYFAPNAPPFRLMNREAKCRRLAKLGVDVLYEVPFDAATASLSPEAFAGDVLGRDLGVQHVVVGRDFRFGKGRKAGAEALRAFGAKYGYDVTLAPLLSSDGAGEPTSSTRIRYALSDGRPREAASMLGHWHRIEGPILHGDKRGRDLGYPTANMTITGLHPPRFGVYAVLVDVLDGPHAGAYQGVASLGIRPMFDGDDVTLETYIFDFDAEIYGCNLSVALVDYLRPEAKFDGLDGLIDQMNTDSAQAKSILAQV